MEKQLSKLSRLMDEMDFQDAARKAQIAEWASAIVRANALMGQLGFSDCAWNESLNHPDADKQLAASLARIAIGG